MADPLAGLVLAGFEGTDLAGAQPLLELGVGGFVLFGRNVVDPAQVHGLLGDLRAAAGRDLLLAVDQEGGRVARLREPLTVWPPMARLGEAGDADLAERVGAALASEVGAVGFNLVFAPVLDVHFEGTTLAIGDRALAESTEVVAELGAALARGIQGAGLAACGKHFPGHGHVTVDSHLELPRCELGEAELMDRHVAAFEPAIRGGVASIMTAHVVYPALDEQPATLSSTWIDGVLRNRLGFGGVVFTDDLEMGAIVRGHGLGEAAVAAVRAGVDGLLVCSKLEGNREVVRALRAAADGDKAFAARCEQSLGRLADLAAQHPPRPASEGELAACLGRPEHRALASRLGASSAALDPTRAHLA